MRYGLLGLQNHPLMCKYVGALQDKLGLAPAICVLQNVAPGFYGNRELDGFDSSRLLKDVNWNFEVVDSLNGDRSKQILTDAELDCCALISPGAPILKSDVFRIPKAGVLNAHPGLIPEVRGVSPIAWSIVYDIPLGISVHLIDKGIDTGPLIYREEYFPPFSSTYSQVEEHLENRGISFIMDALISYRDKKTFDFMSVEAEYERLGLCTISKSQEMDIENLATFKLEHERSFQHYDSFWRGIASTLFRG